MASSSSDTDTSTTTIWLLFRVRHMKDYVDVDVSNQENVAPVYFQSLSLD